MLKQIVYDNKCIKSRKYVYKQKIKRWSISTELCLFIYIFSTLTICINTVVSILFICFIVLSPSIAIYF